MISMISCWAGDKGSRGILMTILHRLPTITIMVTGCRRVNPPVEDCAARGWAAPQELDPNVSVHSLRVTALTTERERGPDIIDLEDFAGHADPRTTLTYIRNRDRLSRSPAYILRY
jgi:hypothetical protein